MFMKYKEVKNPQWANAEHTVINCEVDFDDLLEEFVPFSASADDMYEHTKEIFSKCIDGEFGEVKEYEPPPPPTEEQLAGMIRYQRDELLKELDAVVSNPMRYASFTDEQKAELAAYRQALLDVPQQDSFPNGVEWPSKPVFI